LANNPWKALWAQDDEARKKQENNLAATEVEHPVIVEPPI
jgi:hypothetical protein